MRTNPKVLKIEDSIKDIVIEGKRLEKYIEQYILDNFTKLECLKLQTYLSIDEFKINDKVFDIPKDFNISNADYYRYKINMNELDKIKNKEQYPVNINNVDWSLLPSYALQLVMCKNKEWVVSSGSMKPLNGRWVTYIAHCNFNFLDFLDLPFYIEPVEDWQVSYTSYDKPKKISTHFVNCI